MRSLTTFAIILICASTQVWAQKNAPNEKSTVKKEYDDNGNLIQYDSTYVWSWNSDSTLNFSPDGNFAFGEGFSEMFGDFFADSVFQKFGFLNEQKFPPDKEEFFKHFQHLTPDSMFFHGYPFEADSTFSQFDDRFHRNFNFPDIEEFKKHFQEQFKQHNLKIPEFNTPEQQEEWEKLMKKQQKEKEELMKKWEGKKE